MLNSIAAYCLTSKIRSVQEMEYLDSHWKLQQHEKDKQKQKQRV